MVFTILFAMPLSQCRQNSSQTQAFFRWRCIFPAAEPANQTQEPFNDAACRFAQATEKAVAPVAAVVVRRLFRLRIGMRQLFERISSTSMRASQSFFSFQTPPKKENPCGPYSTTHSLIWNHFRSEWPFTGSKMKKPPACGGSDV